MDLGLNGKVAIIAAASSGLGRAVAEELAREGAQVAICARTAERLRVAAVEIQRATGKELFWRAADVSSPEAVKEFVRLVNERFGRVDICVTNAGGPPARMFSEISDAEWRSTVDLTLMSTVHFAREVLPGMAQRGWGRLLTITSVSVKEPIAGLLLSNSIRAAVTGLARTLANEYGGQGITVNNICPGYTLTDRLAELAAAQAAAAGVSTETIYSRWIEQVPAGRLGRPAEFAALAAFLVSERASYINGTSIAVDGGRTRSLL